MSILPQVSVNTSSYAFQLGINSAKAGESCVPETIFVSRRQQVDFAAGFESISGPTFATVQFTGSELPKPVQVAHKRRDGGEYVRWTDLNADKVLKAVEARGKRIEAMMAKTVAIMGPEYEGEILFAV